MSEKIKALINSIFVQLNRYEKQQSDFSAEAFLRDCESYFNELDRVDLTGDAGIAIDEHLKQRINTVSHQAQPVAMAVTNLLALYFWFVRRPPQQCQNAFVAAKKLRGIIDDGQYVEQGIAPLIFGEKIKGFGKQEYAFRTMLLHRAGQINANFKESDQGNISATRMIRTDSWQKKMIHIASLNRQGRKGEIRSVAPQEELRLISSHNEFASWYLRIHEIYKGENPILRFLKKFFDAIGSLILSVFNYRFVFHVLRDRWPVYLVYLILVLAFVFSAISVKGWWVKFHHAKYIELTQTSNRPAGGK